MKRKSMKEIRLEERARGFDECLSIILEHWRRQPEHLRNSMWPIIEKADSKMNKIDLEYKEVIWPRVYGEPYPKLEK